ncbi:MAG: hypothetical protein ACM3VT_03755 [Solirubrobacterales bacterium]
MKDLIAKVGRFCENHVEKIVLGLAILISAWLFFTRVIFSPNMVALQGKSYSPGKIDQQIYDEKTQELSVEIASPKSGTARPYTPKLTGAIDPCDKAVAGTVSRPLPKGFAGLFDSPLSFIDATKVARTAPATNSRLTGFSRKYRLPQIPDVADVAISRIRAAAYVPTQEVTTGKGYDAGSSEPNDIDLVTVEARFDTAELYRRFAASFNGVDVQKEEWRDPCLADPAFAAVQLQRQELLEDGSWSEWKPIPRSRIDANRKLFDVVETVQNLPPGGLDVRMMQYRPRMIRLSLLQPESYQIASSEEDWFPPSFYSKFKDLQRKVEADERREQMEQDRNQSDRGTDNRRGDTMRGGAGGAQTGLRGGNRRGGTQMGMGGDTGLRSGRGTRGGNQTGDPMAAGARRGGARRGGDDGGMYGDMMYGMPGAGPDGRQKASTDEVYFDLREEMLPYNVDLAKKDKPILVWAFDDTAEPGKVYQYRLRVGVFNPVAGTDQLIDRDQDKKNQVILWSRFSQIQGPVAIPEMVYLFAKNVQEKSKTATVEVARYKLGYWRTEDFQVRPGESIGKTVDTKDKESDRNRNRDRDRRMAMMNQMGAGGGRITDPRGDMMTDPTMMYGMVTDPTEASQPKEVDYTTGSVLLDLVEVNDWGDAPNLKPRKYYDMLYTSDGVSIEHMPAGTTNWPQDLADAYQIVQSDKRREPKPFRSFTKSSNRGGMMDPYGGGGMYGPYPGGAGGGAYNR